MVNNDLVGGWATPLKNMSSSVRIMIPNIWKNKQCSKPPIRSGHNFEYVFLNIRIIILSVGVIFLSSVRSDVMILSAWQIQVH